jgi:hypothetical protein
MTLIYLFLVNPNNKTTPTSARVVKDTDFIEVLLFSMFSQYKSASQSALPVSSVSLKEFETSDESIPLPIETFVTITTFDNRGDAAGATQNSTG